MFNSSSLLVTRDEVRTESGLKKSGFCQKIKVRTLRTKVRTQTDLKNEPKGPIIYIDVYTLIGHIPQASAFIPALI